MASLSLNASQWHGFTAFTLESDRLRLVTVPALGAKIVSLVDKHRDHEWLLQPAQLPAAAAYGSGFVAAGLYGWDEMFPTIDPCPYPVDGPYSGVALPDHGEVWALRWDVLESGEAFALQVEGVALPYRLRRTMRFVDASTVQIDYWVENTGSDAFMYLWAAHPLFAADSATQLELPASVEEVVSIHHADTTVRRGDRLPWPPPAQASGAIQALDRLDDSTVGTSQKYAVSPENPVGTAALRHGGKGISLRLTWSASELPYLAVWADNRAYARQPNLAIEPMTGYFDSLPVALANQRVSHLYPGQPAAWSLTISLEGP